MKTIILLMAFATITSCQKTSETAFTQQFELPKTLKEISGFIYDNNNKTLFCLEDSGNDNTIIVIDSAAKIQKEITITNATNVDWEDITKDKSNNLYIGDFGNNDNNRRDLCIYKINAADLTNTNCNSSQKTTFNYPEQTDFPAKKKSKLFDVEGFFELDNHFYLITKNRNKNFDGRALIYKIPNQAGEQTAVLIGEINTGTNFENGAVTSAAISTDGKKVVLLTHSKVILFTDFATKPFFEGTRTDISLNHVSQKESVCFKDEQTLFIADEQDKKTGGMVYVLNLF